MRWQLGNRGGRGNGGSSNGGGRRGGGSCGGSGTVEAADEGGISRRRNGDENNTQERGM